MPRVVSVFQIQSLAATVAALQENLRHAKREYLRAHGWRYSLRRSVNGRRYDRMVWFPPKGFGRPNGYPALSDAFSRQLSSEKRMLGDPKKSAACLACALDLMNVKHQVRHIAHKETL